MRSKRFQQAFDKLAAAEVAFLEREFLAPVVPGKSVRVRIAGVVCELRVAPPNIEGWCVLRPVSHSSARRLREAGLAERQRYLALFPLVRLILCRRDQRSAWLAVPAHRGDQRFRIEGLVPVWLVDEAAAFEVVRTRFDGANFWFESREPTRDPATAAFLRKSLRESIEPNRLARTGLTPEERTAYAVNHELTDRARKQREADANEHQLGEALGHAGAQLLDFVERSDGYRVTYSIGGRQHVSSVGKDLAVQAAGICLSVQDEQFDLTSLVGVIREAEGRGEMVGVD
jgi:hypothetical protein